MKKSTLSGRLCLVCFGFISQQIDNMHLIIIENAMPNQDSTLNINLKSLYLDCSENIATDGKINQQYNCLNTFEKITTTNNKRKHKQMESTQ